MSRRVRSVARRSATARLGLSRSVAFLPALQARDADATVRRASDSRLAAARVTFSVALPVPSATHDTRSLRPREPKALTDLGSLSDALTVALATVTRTVAEALAPCGSVTVTLAS